MFCERTLSGVGKIRASVLLRVSSECGWRCGMTDCTTTSEESIVVAHDLLFTPLHWVLRNNKLWITQYHRGPALPITTMARRWRFAEVSRMQFHSFSLRTDEDVSTCMIILLIPLQLYTSVLFLVPLSLFSINVAWCGNSAASVGLVVVLISPP